MDTAQKFVDSVQLTQRPHVPDAAEEACHVLTGLQVYNPIPSNSGLRRFLKPRH